MALCDDCVAKNQCGNDNVVFCLSYVKDVPTKWETERKMVVELLKKVTKEDIVKSFEDAIKVIETMPAEDYAKLCNGASKFLEEKHEE